MIDTSSAPKTVVVIGNGMVGHRFCEKLVELDRQGQYRIVTFCEEPRAAYDRVGLTRFFTDRDPERLMLTNTEWYEQQGIALHVGDKATSIDRDARIVRSAKGREIPYDVVVLATGSAPFVPPIPGVDKKGVFVYRTIEDLEAIIAGAFPISRSRAHTHRRHGHPLQTVPSAGLIERPQEKNRVDALR